MRPAIALALIALTGCTDLPEFTEPPVTRVTYPIPGTYALAAIGGDPLPAQYPVDVSITSSRLTVLADGAWSEARLGITIMDGQVKNLGWAGRWTQFENSNVTFHVGSTPYYTGVSTSSGFLLASGGTVFTYVRE